MRLLPRAGSALLPALLLPVLLLPAVLLVACGGQAADPQAARPDIEALLEEYLPLLGEAYSGNDPSPVEGLAAARETAAIEKRLRDIRLEGRRLAPTFRSMTIEEIKVWGYANAYVTTQEIWDIRTYATGTEQLLTEQKGQRNRVKYQLKKIDGRWMVLFRTILEQ
jgi:hypothetical protein